MLTDCVAKQGLNIKAIHHLYKIYVYLMYTFTHQYSCWLVPFFSSHVLIILLTCNDQFTHFNLLCIVMLNEYLLD